MSCVLGIAVRTVSHLQNLIRSVDSAVVYVRSDGSKFATDSAKFAANPATAEKFFLKGTRLDKLKGQMEPIDVSTRVLMDAAILRQQIAVVCTKSIQLEARTAAFLNSETDTTLPPT